ncbi:alpha/beta-hydrolase N-terminal domain-containing protein [Williamsia soli]|uniref:alpha/beta-hydrolase N-terminal domain-containing protein n=1 Tax=Williamsia soli TaxID=364929 RepID=UPI0027DE8F57|nr:alpha/beta-hydrolase N-terminal domain-containing protein [Williamsia soli]
MAVVWNQLVPKRMVFGGLVVATVSVWLSMTPSLLPRGWLFQGVVSGASAAIGYGVGVLGSMLVRYVVRREASANAKRIAWRVLAGVGATGTILGLVWFGSWQSELRDLMGTEEFGAFGYPLVRC